MITTTETGNRLRLTLCDDGRAELLESDDRESLVAEWLHELYEFIRPEEIGALTDSPILCDCDSLDYSGDDRSFHPDARIFWFPDYYVRDEWQELAEIGHVDFVRAPE